MSKITEQELDRFEKLQNLNVTKEYLELNSRICEERWQNKNREKEATYLYKESDVKNLKFYIINPYEKLDVVDGKWKYITTKLTLNYTYDDDENHWTCHTCRRFKDMKEIDDCIDEIIKEKMKK